ncbi:MAG TPA: deoxyribose-phosphate aldolase [Firmicutes bacterium]|nr:deoxyribose-phosphate aldolase [Bacillota bacterium]
MKITCDSPECSGCGLCLDKNIDAVKNIIENGADRIGSKPGITSDVPEDVAKYIDHTLLKPQVTDEEIRVLCDEARRYKFASVCVNPAHVEACSRLLKGSPVKVCTVIGFPLGATTSQVKAFETREAITKGAEEIDMVINIGALKSKKYSLVEEDIREVVKAAQGRLVKVILETGLLNQEEKVAGCLLSKAAGADFVKTSTGFGPGGATAEDIFLMRTVVGKEMGVKASGGVKDYKTAKEMIDAGATRIGASAGVKIIKGDSDSSGKEKPADY